MLSLRSDIERTLEDWMDEQKVGNAWEIAPTLVSPGYQQDELDGSDRLAPINSWLPSSG
jgi:hypothetical protein